MKGTYTGRIKNFNGQFGFIISEIGETFFHKTGLKSDFYPQKDDEVEFQIEPSPKKQGEMQACEIMLIEQGEKEYLVGTVKRFDDTRGFGFISADNTDYFIHKSDLLSTTSIFERDIVIFCTKLHKGRISATKCQPFLVGLNHCSAESQSELLQKYLSISSSDYERIKFIAQFNKIDATVKAAFLKYAFEKANTEYQYKMLIDGLINLSAKDQIKFLQKYLSELGEIEEDLGWNVSDKNWRYNTIKSIYPSDKINETAKATFLKSAFEKASAEYQYKMLFEDCLIDIQKETIESQIELFQKYLSRLGKIKKDSRWNVSDKDWKYDKIQSISQSDKIGETAKATFLKSAFEIASTEYQYKMLFEDCLIDIQKETIESQIELLQKYLSKPGNISYSNYDHIKFIAQFGKIDETVKATFLKLAFEEASAEYQYKMLFEDCLIDIQKETTECQIKLFQNYLSGLGEIEKDSGWNVSNKDWRYDKIQSIFQSDKIGETAKATFLKSAFEKASAEYQYKMLFEDCLIDIQKETLESQIELFQKYLSTLGNISYSSYNQIKSIRKSNKIDKTAKATFLKSAFEKISTEYQCKMLIDGLIILSEESQIELLQKYLSELGEIEKDWHIKNEDWKYDKIKSIHKSNKIDKIAKATFLESAFEKASVEYQYKVLFEDCLIDIQRETIESQIELLQNLERLNIDQVKLISQSDKIDETAKALFLKSTFEAASAEYQYEMFAEELITVSTEEQQPLLQRYLSELGEIEKDWRYDKIKLIHKSDKIGETAKATFLKSAFEIASTEYQYKMLFEDYLIDIQKETNESQIELLQNLKRLNIDQVKLISQSDKIDETAKALFLKSTFEAASAEYQYKMFAEELIILSAEEQQSLLQRYLSELGKIGKDSYWNFKNNDLKYNKIKSIYQSDKIDETAKTTFLNSAFETASAEYQSKMLFEDHLIDYSEISKIDRLRLWLNRLNPHYNYLEFVQATCQLSNDERKLFNKRLKEHAKEERLQKFIDQIPTATLIEETERTKTYKCKWRNLYYRQGAVLVFLNKTTSTESYCWEPAQEEWNLLTQEYFNNRRIDDIIVTVNNNNCITEITGLEDIEVQIVLAEVRKNGRRERKTNISSNQLTKIIHNVAARNQCVNFLASQQSDDYKAIDIQELLTDDYGSLRRDVSFLFSTPDENDNVYLIWESVEFEKSKATHIFKCDKDVFEEVENKIKNYIEHNVRTRSRLNGVEIEDLIVKRDLNYFCRVNHDTVDYQVWENRMREVLPFLKKI